MILKHPINLTVIILLSCAGTIIAATQNDSIKYKMAVDSIAAGNQLYVKSCTRCHKLKDPAKYSMAQWPGLVNKMQKRAKITDEQKAMILSYLATEAKK